MDDLPLMGKLVLGRREGESIEIDHDITITVASIRGEHVRLLIEAPKNKTILRSELRNRKDQDR